MPRWSTRRVRGPVVRALRLAHGYTGIEFLDHPELAALPRRDSAVLSHIEAGRGAWFAWIDPLAAALNVAPDVITGQVPAIAALRTAAGITPTTLAADLGITPHHLAALERGSQDPDPALAARLARRLAVPVDVVSAHQDAA